QLRHAHPAPRALEELIRGNGSLLALPRKLAEAEFEDARHAGGAAVGLYRAVELREIAAGPEVVLELVRLAHRAPEKQALPEDDGPGAERGKEQQPDHDLDGDARLDHQANNGELSVHILRRSGQHIHEGLGQPSRLQCARIDAGNPHPRDEQRRLLPGVAPPEDRLLEPDRCRPIGARLAGDGELIIQPRRTAILDGEAGHREHNTGLLGERMLRIAERPQPLRARALQEAQIVRIIDYPAPVGVFPVYTGRPGEDAHWPSSKSDSGAAARSGALTPKCKYEARLTMRPRAVRTRNPCWMRKGSITSSRVPRSSPMAAARLSMPTGPPSNLSMMVSRSLRSRVSKPWGSTSSRSRAASATPSVIRP